MIGDALAHADALRGEGVRERVGALVHLAERERAGVVDDRHLVREARRGGRVAAGGRRSPAQQREARAGDAVGPVRAEDAHPRERGDGRELRVDAGGDLADVVGIHGAQSFIPAGGAGPGGAVARLDEAADVGRPAGVEEDVALAHGGLLRQQPGADQRLADGLGELALVAGEAAREVGEVRVVAAPLPHAVEPLEDPPRDPPGGVGVLVRAGGPGALRVEQGVDRLLVLLDGARRPPAGRRAARPPRRCAAGGRRRSARAAPTRRARRPGRRGRGRAGGRGRRRAPRRPAGRARRAPPGRAAAREREHEEARRARRRASARSAPRAAARRARPRSTSAPTVGGDEEPRALGGLLRVGAQRGGDRRGGEQAVGSAARRRPRPASRSPSARGRARRGRGAARRAGGRAGGRWRAADAPAPPASASAAARRSPARGERRLEGARGPRSPRTAKTTRSSAEPASRWRRPPPTSIRAASSTGKPPTPVPKATSARLRAPSASALASVAAVARRMMSADVGPPSSIVAAWMTQRRGHVAGRRLHRLAEPDRRRGAGLLVDGGPAGAPDGARDAAAVAAARCSPRWRSRRPPAR